MNRTITKTTPFNGKKMRFSVLNLTTVMLFLVQVIAGTGHL